MENEVKISAIEVQKELMKSKVMAKFSHYEKGKLFYTVELESGIYQFPMSVIDKVYLKEYAKNNAYTEKDGYLSHVEKMFTTKEGVDVINIDNKNDFEELAFEKLSEDLGSTKFFGEIRGSELFRWIKKSISNEDFMKIN